MHAPGVRYLPRDIDAGDLIENFLVSAVVSILFIRVFLYLTGYPSLSGQNFHIAHMLFGGFLMMTAIISLFVFLNKEIKYFASVVGGIGFGTFIDELGKYITNDNNYFYQPAIAIIYVIFILLFLAVRLFERYVNFTKEEYSINAIEMTKQVLIHDLDKEEKKLALSYFRKSDREDPIVKSMIDLLEKVVPLPIKKPSFLHQVRDFMRELYIRLTHSKRFSITVIFFFVAFSIFNFLGAFWQFSKVQTFAEWGQLVFSLTSGLFVLIGIYFLHSKNLRKNSYEMFKVAILISLFLTQFFRFLDEQFSAVGGLLINLIILSVLQYLIYEEKVMEKEN